MDFAKPSAIVHPPRSFHSTVSHDAPTRLMLACLRAGTDGVSPFQIARLSVSELANFAWPRLGELAAEHGVQPLIYRRLKRYGEVPPAAINGMRAQYYGSSLHNLKLARELIRLTTRLEAAGISALAFKGPVLALKLRGNLSLRQFNDLDLLVRREDAGHAAEVLIAEKHHPRHFDLTSLERSLSRSNEDEFIRHSDLQMIDLHWDLNPPYFPYGPPSELVWPRAERFSLAGGEVLTMGSLDTTLFLATHGTKHGWANLGGIYDLAVAMAHLTSEDLPEIMTEADSFGCLGMLLLGAVLARNLLGAALPSAIADRIAAAPELSALALGVERRMFNYVGLRPGLYLDWYVSLRVLRDSRSRVRYVANRALRPAPEDAEFLELPAALYPLYFPLRPFRLLLQHGKRLFTDVPMWRKPVKRMPP